VDVLILNKGMTCDSMSALAVEDVPPGAAALASELGDALSGQRTLSRRSWGHVLRACLLEHVLRVAEELPIAI